jgi:hypothetical protein
VSSTTALKSLMSCAFEVAIESAMAIALLGGTSVYASEHYS